MKSAKKKSTSANPAHWSRFKRWRSARPFVGSILMMIASLFILWGPISLFRFVILPGSMIWAALLVGSMLFLMGLVQLFVPTYALMAGAIGIVLSLISLIVALGGLGIGMILGIVGGALSVAWKPKVLPIRSIQPIQPEAGSEA